MTATGNAPLLAGQTPDSAVASARGVGLRIRSLRGRRLAAAKRCISEVAARVGLSWPTVRAAVTAQTAALLSAGLAPVQVLEIDAKSEGINRAVKLIARSAYGFRNPTNQQVDELTVPDRRQPPEPSTRPASSTAR